MGIEIGTALLIGSAVASATGAVVSYVGAQQQAEAAQRAAEYNARIAEQNAQLEAQAIYARYQQEVAAAESQAAFQRYQEQVQRNQATALEQQAEAERRQAEENKRRKRDEDERRLARLQAAFSSGGVETSSGTPVAALSETAGILELEVVELGRQAEATQQRLYYDAEIVRAGAVRTSADAALSDIRAENARFNQSTSRYVADLGTVRAAQTRISGANQAAGIRLGATSNLISSAGRTFSSFA